MHHKGRKTLWSLAKNYLMSAVLSNMGKIWPSLFFNLRIAFFLKNLVPSTFYVRKHDLLTCTKKCQNTFCTPGNSLLKFVWLDFTRKGWPKFFHLKNRLFFKSLSFQQTLGFQWNDFYNFHHKCKNTFRSLIKRYSIFATVGIGWKSWQKCFFFQRDDSLYFEKKIGSIDFLGPKGMILNLAQKMSKNIV